MESLWWSVYIWEIVTDREHRGLGRVLKECDPWNPTRWNPVFLGKRIGFRPEKPTKRDQVRPILEVLVSRSSALPVQRFYLVILDYPSWPTSTNKNRKNTHSTEIVTTCRVGSMVVLHSNETLRITFPTWYVSSPWERWRTLYRVRDRVDRHWSTRKRVPTDTTRSGPLLTSPFFFLRTRGKSPTCHGTVTSLTNQRDPEDEPQILSVLNKTSNGTSLIVEIRLHQYYIP